MTFEPYILSATSLVETFRFDSTTRFAPNRRQNVPAEFLPPFVKPYRK